MPSSNPLENFVRDLGKGLESIFGKLFGRCRTCGKSHSPAAHHPGALRLALNGSKVPGPVTPLKRRKAPVAPATASRAPAKTTSTSAGSC